MKKFLNSSDALLEESLDGFVAAHADMVVAGDERKFIRRKKIQPGKVGLVSGGGSGHEPLHAGFVGLGMLDAACPGHVFTSPTPDKIVAAVEAVDQGAGVVLIVQELRRRRDEFRYGGRIDRRALRDGSHRRRCRGGEVNLFDRRGVAGTLIVEKMVGAAAEAGLPRDALKTLGEAVNRRTRSMGVALTSCTTPAAGKPNFELGENEMEMGVGIHGEPGRRRVALGSARSIAEEVLGAILGDLRA